MCLIHYWNELHDGNVVYSIDKVVLVGRFRDSVIKRKENKVTEEKTGNEFDLNFVSSIKVAQIVFDIFSRCTYSFDHYLSGSKRPGFYKDNFIFYASDDCTFWLGVGLNSPGHDSINSWKLEFNPNKCVVSPAFPFVISLLRQYSVEWNLKDWDLAIDYPVLRENCFMIKDRRKYSLVENSGSDKTEYLGNRHQNGYTKLYNKQLESFLNYPLTRLELTLQGVPSVGDIESLIPSVYCLKDLQMTFDSFSLNGTDRVLLWAVINEPSLLIELPRDKRKKIECALQQHTLKLGTDKKSLLGIIQQIELWRQLVIPNV